MITYSSVISYFKEFADKHIQLNSFSYGALDKLELKKINEYPALHIVLTNSDISDKVVVYDFDVYVFSGIAQQSEEDEEVKESAYTDTLMILQDLRAEFTEGKYIVNTNQLLLQGSNEISCTPIEERFNNMVIGFSTSISVESANETTACTIPYPKYNGQNIFELWNNDKITFPTMTHFDSDFYWWSFTEQVQSNLTYTNDGVTQVAPISTGTYLSSNNIVTNSNTLTNPLRYNSFYRGLEFKGSSQSYNIGQSFSQYKDRQLYVVLKLKNIVDTETGNNTLLNIENPAGTQGVRILVGGSKASSNKNTLFINDIQNDVNVSVQNISDDSNDYIREESITIGIAFFGSEMNGGIDDTCKVYLNGIERATIDTNGRLISKFNIGNSTNGNSKFILQECYLKQVNSVHSNVADFPKLMAWLKNR